MLNKNAQATLVKYAYKHLGKPYKYGAKPSEAPRFFDCSSFTQYLYKRIGTTLPRRSIDQAALGQRIEAKESALQVGDLIFIRGKQGRYNEQFRTGIGHVAVYVGDGTVIHAKWNATDGGSVIEEPVQKLLDRKDLVAIKRIL